MSRGASCQGRRKTGAEKRAKWGYVYLHCVIDDLFRASSAARS
jgi:hypothetical protein